MTREDAERKIRSVFTNYFRFAGDREADEVIEALKQKPSYQLASHNDNDEAKSVLFDMLGKGMYVKDTKENQAILVALRALEQDTKEIYNKGFADGQKALAEHLKLCKEEKGWIPVSERLPEKTGIYLISIGDLVTSKSFDGHNFRTESEVRFIPDAWMPLPEPYKAESKIKQASAYADQDTLMPAT